MFHLPRELISYIFEYDNTYKVIYNDVINDMNKKEAKKHYNIVMNDLMCYFEYIEYSYFK